MRKRLLSPSNGILQQVAVQAFIVFAVAILLYANTLSHDYVLDDRMVFTENEYALRGLEGIDNILIHDSYNGFVQQHQEIRAGGQYRPFSIITFAIEYEFFGVNPTISHGINVLIYAFTCLLLLFSLRKMFRKHKLTPFLQGIMPFLATLIFVVHPIHTEVVAHVHNRDELLAFFFLLVAIHLVLVETGKSLGFKLLLIPPLVLSFGLALISNEISIVFLVILPLILYTFTDVKRGEMLVLAVPFWLTLAGYMRAQNFFSTDPVQLNDLINNPFLNASFSEFCATLIFVGGKYLQVLLFPVDLSHDYSFNQIPLKSFADPMVWVILIFYVVGFVVAVLTLLRRRNVLSFTFLYFITSLVVTGFISNLVFPTGTLMSESLLYIPSLGLCIGSVYLIYYLVENIGRFRASEKSRKRVYGIAWIISTCLIVALSMRTHSRNQDWKDSFTLLKEDVHHAPQSARIRNLLANEYLVKSEAARSSSEKLDLINEGIMHLKKGLEIYPQNAEAWVLLGNTEIAVNDPIKAHACYMKAIKIDSTEERAYKNLAEIEIQRRNYTNGIFYTKKWIQYQSKSPAVTAFDKAEAFTQLGDLFAKIDSLDYAIIAYNTALKQNPENVMSYVGLGLASERKSGSMTTAIQNFRKALKYDPTNTVALQHLGLSLARKGDYENAIKSLKEAIRIEEDNPDLYRNLAQIYEEQGKEELANSYYRRAQALD
ncbi:MAG: tetratricopeptide repeat protein [Bacteroidota bacterium]